MYLQSTTCYFKESIDTNVGVMLNLENSSLVLGIIGYFIKLAYKHGLATGSKTNF
jgi:hypothetical protein